MSTGGKFGISSNPGPTARFNCGVLACGPDGMTDVRAFRKAGIFQKGEEGIVGNSELVQSRSPHPMGIEQTIYFYPRLTLDKPTAAN